MQRREKVARVLIGWVAALSFQTTPVTPTPAQRANTPPEIAAQKAERDDRANSAREEIERLNRQQDAGKRQQAMQEKLRAHQQGKARDAQKRQTPGREETRSSSRDRPSR